MNSDRYRQRFLLQLGILLINCFVLFWLVFSSAWYAAIVVSVVVLVAQVLLILRYLDQSNRAIARFLVTVKYDDVSQGFFREQAPASFRQLGQAMEDGRSADCRLPGESLDRRHAGAFRPSETKQCGLIRRV